MKSVPETTVTSVPRFLHELEAYPSSLYWVFRGQADVSWALVPKAGRAGYYLREKHEPPQHGLPPRDICRFNYWREQAVAYNLTLPTNDFECLALAQHYGLATRLLDWTTNPLVALSLLLSAAQKRKAWSTVLARKRSSSPLSVRWLRLIALPCTYLLLSTDE